MNTRQVGFVFVVILLMTLAGCTSRNNPAPTVPNCPAGNDCSGISLTSTMAVVTPAADDLGWGEVRGRVSDTINGAPIAGATVTCTHRSNHPVSLCTGSVKTADDGSFVFAHIFFQATDSIELSASEPTYGGDFFRQEFFTHPSLYVTFSLPVINRTPQPCCTAPACGENEVYSCPGVCPCGCGTTCATKTITPNGFPTQTPSITPTPISFSCIDCADGRNALRYFCPLAGSDETSRALLNPYGQILEGSFNQHKCLYVIQSATNLMNLYYVNLASSTVTQIIIDPSLLPPPESVTPQ